MVCGVALQVLKGALRWLEIKEVSSLLLMIMTINVLLHQGREKNDTSC